ncbi:MAG: peptidylprolyl isomerase, partial [Clostridiales bacterium]|nr:peptidylprolyl isomerase [Clostridiales bacterium]
MKRILAVILCLAFVLAFTGCNKDTGTDPNASATPGADASPTGPVEPVIIKCEMVIKDYGVLKIDLYAHKAPQTVYNFVYLAKQGYYNGIIFHKVVDGYSIQAGKYEQGFVARVPAKGPYTIFGEFEQNGFENSLSHGRGVLSMARMAKDTEDGISKYDTGSTEFFICLSTANSLSLNGSFAAFG